MIVTNMRAGLMRDSIRIERLDPTLDEWGKQTGGYTEVLSCRANITFESGSEPFSDERRQGVQKAIVVMRYAPGIRTKDRVVDLIRGEVWDIKSIEDRKSMRAILELTVERRND